MPELLPARVWMGLRRTIPATVCLLPLCGWPAGVLAQNVPAGLRACAAESDPGMRLDCYDREMKRLLAAPAQPSKPTAPAQPDVPSSAANPPADAAAPTPAPPKVAQSEPAPPRHTAAWNIFGGTLKVTARVVSLDRSPDALVLRLDNGQVWQQIGRASGDLTLRAGDEVTIEEHLGSYWLSSRYVSAMRVRQQPQ